MQSRAQVLKLSQKGKAELLPSSFVGFLTALSRFS